jgi:hypothetical protein
LSSNQQKYNKEKVGEKIILLRRFQGIGARTAQQQLGQDTSCGTLPDHSRCEFEERLVQSQRQCSANPNQSINQSINNQLRCPASVKNGKQLERHKQWK